jgi:hypothetical protein
MPLPTAIVTVRQNQRHAAIAFVSAHTPSEAASVLLADARVTHPADLIFLRDIRVRVGRMTPHAHERLVRIASSLMDGST